MSLFDIPFKKPGEDLWTWNGQLWKMFVCSEEEKEEYIKKQLGSVGKLVTPSDCKSDADGIASSSLAAPTNLPRM